MTIIPRMMHGVTIGQRKTDGYLNATKLAKAYEQATGKRKDVRDWLKTDRAKAYIEYLSQKTGIPVFCLVEQVRGRNGGTWLHPKLAVPFGTWLSVEFEFEVSEWVEEWIRSGQPPQFITIEQWLDIAIIKIPKRWHLHFKMEWFAEACRLNGWQVYEHGTGPAAMSKFINATVYDVLPKGTRDRIDEVNPIDPTTGKRRKKNHQHFNSEVDETILKAHIKTVFDLMASSASLYQFWELMRNRFGGGLQLPIPGVVQLPGS